MNSPITQQYFDRKLLPSSSQASPLPPTVENSWFPFSVYSVCSSRFVRCRGVALTHAPPSTIPILPSIPQLSADEREWVDTGAILHPSPTLPAWADVFRDPMQGPLRRLPWHAPAWNAGKSGSAFVPGLVRKHIAF